MTSGARDVETRAIPRLTASLQNRYKDVKVPGQGRRLVLDA